MQTISPTENKPISIPYLENGDSLNSIEFEQRYTAMPHIKKAELIEGIVYMASPLRFEPHAEPHANIMGWLWTYQILTPGVRLGDNPTVRLDLENQPQPDAVLIIDPKLGGQTRISEDDYIEGAPELVVEVAASTASIDLQDKKRAYRRNGVQEYIVWRRSDNQLDWFVLDPGEYVSLLPDAQGVIRSRKFPGLWLAVEALLEGNMVEVLATLQEGLSSPEHAEFVK